METNTKFTQGNWEVSKHGNNDSFGIHAGGNDFAIVKGGNEEGGESEANAKLIAAAPELLKTLIIVNATIEEQKEWQGTRLHDFIKEAINKAIN